jgi:hypothetical protein
MTDPYDPYRPNPSQNQQPYGAGQYRPQPPYRGQNQPYQGQGQPYQGQGQPYQGQGQPPYQSGPPYHGQGHGQSQGGTPYHGQGQGGQPDATRPFEPYGTQQFDPYGTQQPPYQGSYGQPGGWSGPGGPGGFPPQPPRRSKAPLIVLAVTAVLVLIGGGIAGAIVLTGNDEPSATPDVTTSAPDPTTTSRRPTTRPPTTGGGSNEFEAGRCATLTPEENDRATIRITECGSLLSDVVIAKVQSSECPEPFLSFNPGEGKVYCLAMDAKEGDCFRLDKLIKRAIACVGDETHRVIKIYDGVADAKQCDTVPGTVDVYAYPDPPKTLCLGKAGV